MTQRFNLTQFFIAEAPKLRRFLRRFGPANWADDIAQDAFLHFCAADRRAVLSPRAYLFATARNLALESLRRARRAPVEGAAVLDVGQSWTRDPNPEERLIAAEDEAALRAALLAMPPLQREALLLRRLARLPPDEVAARLGVSERQMQRLVLKAIAFCHARLAADGDNVAAGD